jgi:hypothetical protein
MRADNPATSKIAELPQALATAGAEGKAVIDAYRK